MHDSNCQLGRVEAMGAKFMQLEELRELKNKVRANTMPSEKNTFDWDGGGKGTFRHMEYKPTRFSWYTPLNTARSRLLDEALQKDLMSPLRKSQTLPNAYMKKDCRYHCNYGRTSNECATFKDKIEEFIQVSHLRWFVKRNDVSNSCSELMMYDDRRECHWAREK